MSPLADSDTAFMRLAIREAKKGIGRTSPNPIVGAVVVKEGRVVGKGYHHRAGTPHAEVHALKTAGNLAAAGSLYVTLEPCNHIGRTPPCTRAILASGISRVVIGMADPNPAVAGNGATYLRQHGLAVVMGVLEDRCRQMNRPFIKHSTTGMPWVILKAALSIDGKLATSTGHSGWISGEKARAEVHRLRDRVDAIMIGSGTAASDDPSLTARLVGRKGSDPLRVVVDTELQMKTTARMLRQQSAAPTWIFCADDLENQQSERRLAAAGAVIKKVARQADGNLSLQEVLAELGRCQINSVLVEGGGRIHSSLLRTGLADEAYFFHAPVLLGNDGVAVMDGFGGQKVSDGIRLQGVEYRRYGDDMLLHGYFRQLD
jgi:diaminohydroxyphosphoribosylaminopyrimidine deaminase/5-amino-6-(5-phosphoribosylamino)uracil reductase